MLKTNQTDLAIQASSIKDELKQLEQNTSTFREELNILKNGLQTNLKEINDLKNQTENSKTELEKLKESKKKNFVFVIILVTAKWPFKDTLRIQYEIAWATKKKCQDLFL